MLTILKGLPLSYFKDLQDDKELVFNSYDQIKNCLKVLREVITNFTPNKKRMTELSHVGYITSTDIADFIVKDLNYPFRKAYSITAKIVNLAEKKGKKINELTFEEIKTIDKKISVKILDIMNIKNAVNTKKSYGGTSFDNIKKMIKKYKKEIK